MRNHMNDKGGKKGTWLIAEIDGQELTSRFAG